MAAGRIVQLLAWPAQLAPLLVILLFSVALGVALNVPVAGWPLVGVLVSWFLNYSVEILEQALGGAREAPALSIEMLYSFGGWGSLVLLIVLVGVLVLSGAAAWHFGAAGAVLTAALVAAVLPAVLGLYALTGKLGAAFSPAVWFDLVRRLRADYLILLAAVVLLWILAYAAFAATAKGLPLIVALALVLYGWLATHALIGGVMHHWRQDEAIDDLLMPLRVLPAEDTHLPQQQNQLIDQLYAQCRSAPLANAWQTLQAHLRESESPVDEMRWIYERVASWPDARLANRLAQDLLPKLLEIHDWSAVLRITRERLAASPDFSAGDSAALLRLARFAREVGDLPAARRLAGNLVRLHPQSAERAIAEDLLREIER